MTALSWQDRRSWPARLVALAAAVTPVLAVVAPLGLVVVLSIAAVAVGALQLVERRALDVPRGLLVLFALLGAWSAISALWAPDWRQALGLLQSVLLVALGGLVLLGTAARFSEPERRRVEDWLLTGFVTALILLAVLGATYWLSGTDISTLIGWSRTPHWFAHNRATTILALLAWPACVAAQRRFGARWAATLGVVTFAILIGYDSVAALLALAVAACGATVAHWRPAVAAVTIAAGAFAGTAMIAYLPGVISFQALAEHPMPTAVYHRLIIWDFAARQVWERPVLGWGFNASRAIPGAETQVIHGPSANLVPVLPLHPHNVALQLWLELGLLGALLGVAVVVAVVRAIRDQPADSVWRAGGYGLLTASFTIAFLSYGIWQRWWMSTLWLAAVFMASVRRRREAGESGQVSEPQP